MPIFLILTLYEFIKKNQCFSSQLAFIFLSISGVFHIFSTLYIQSVTNGYVVQEFLPPGGTVSLKGDERV